MTVNVLVQLLAAYSPDLRVVADGYEHDGDDLSPEQLRLVKTTLGTGQQEWVSKHGDANYLPQEELAGPDVEEALVLRRVSN